MILDDKTSVDGNEISMGTFGFSSYPILDLASKGLVSLVVASWYSALKEVAPTVC